MSHLWINSVFLSCDFHRIRAYRSSLFELFFFFFAVTIKDQVMETQLALRWNMYKEIETCIHILNYVCLSIVHMHIKTNK